MTKEFRFTEQELEELLNDTIYSYTRQTEVVVPNYHQFFVVKEMIEEVKAAQKLMGEEK